MPLKDPTFTIGIEEEYLLVDRASRDLVREMPHALFEAAQQALRGQVAREFLKSQIEVGTGVHASPRAAGAELAALRRTVASLAGEHGLAPIAASTHPFARWSVQEPTERERYQAIAQRSRRRRPPPRHLRHARARRHRGRRAAHRPHEPGPLLPAAPAHALDLLAVRRRRGHRPQVLPPRRLPGAAAHGHARPLRELGGIPPHRRSARCATTSSRTPARSGGTCGPPPASRRSRCASPTCAPGSRTRVCVAAMYVCDPAHALPHPPRQPDLAHLSAVPAVGEPLARAALRRRRHAVRFRQGRAGRLPRPRRGAAGAAREDAEALGCLSEIEHARAIVAAAPAPTGKSPATRVLTAAGAPREKALEGVVDHLIAETVATDPAK